MQKTSTQSSINVWMPCPEWQIKAIGDSAKLQGVNFHSLPVIDIEFIDNTRLSSQLNSADTLLFTSQNAVLGCLQTKSLVELLKQKKIVAIGQATATKLAEYAIHCDYVARPPFTSESLLEDERFWVLNFKSVAVVSGEGGRDVLLRQISERHVNIEKVSVYRRHKTKIPPRNMIEFLRLNNITAVAMTSVEIAEAVTTALKDAGLSERLQSLVVFTFGKRIEKACQALGYSQVYSAEMASQSALLELITKWRSRESNE